MIAIHSAAPVVSHIGSTDRERTLRLATDDDHRFQIGQGFPTTFSQRAPMSRDRAGCQDRDLADEVTGESVDKDGPELGR